jgi:hypothetical protein
MLFYSTNRGFGRAVELATIRIILISSVKAIKLDFEISAAPKGTVQVSDGVVAETF